MFSQHISIHAPAKGATLHHQRLIRLILFQSTLPRRERPCFIHSFSSGGRFQSTLPRRERHLLSLHFPLSLDNFNPRSREGSDSIIKNLVNGIKISIHAPAKGATRTRNDPGCRVHISIHAPAKGATYLQQDFAKGMQFQSTLPRRERRIWLIKT